jgi:ferrous iron transport protein B
MQKIAIVGNPNSGKTTLFNTLTGLNQKVGNYPGVTVDKVVGTVNINNAEYSLIDLPGTYSIHPTSADEREVLRVLGNPNNPDYPDFIIYVADLHSLERHILLFSQIRDLEIPTLLFLNNMDGKTLFSEKDLESLEEEFLCPIIQASSRNSEVKQLLENGISRLQTYHYQYDSKGKDYVELDLPNYSTYQKELVIHHHSLLSIDKSNKEKTESFIRQNNFSAIKEEVNDTLERFKKYNKTLSKYLKKANVNSEEKTLKIDRIITHPVLGVLIFFLIMGFVFQSIFTWASVPMDFIDLQVGNLNEWLQSTLHESMFRDLLTDGIVSGIGAVVIFVPQIAILFLFMSILDEIGYMSRAVFLFDNLMQKFGLNGRSIVALISGSACAIPAIMSTKTISNTKERLITILVTPFVSCSARIPVYILLVGMAVTPKNYFGFLNSQGLAVMFLYVLGFVFALGSSLILKFLIKGDNNSFLTLELPRYKSPVWSNVLLTVKEKVWSFIVGAGKIILILSIIIWGVSSFGPGESMEIAEQTAQTIAQTTDLSPSETENLIASKKLENSYIGILGKTIEPVIKPLGYDWKIGIALITSFAAREVFVSTMSTINSLGSEAEDLSLQELLLSSTFSDGSPVFTHATIWSLLIFYVIAMQCMGTLAVVKKETKGWKWPILQFTFMTLLAYVSAFATFTLLQ